MITETKASRKKHDPFIPAKEHVYLEGPKSRGYELGFAWKVFKELITAIRTLHFVGPCITVFGSARFKEDHRYYEYNIIKMIVILTVAISYTGNTCRNNTTATYNDSI